MTDVDALSAEPGVDVRLVTSPAALADADLVVLPGSRATVSDLNWLRDKGFDACPARAGRGRTSDHRDLRRRCSCSAPASTTGSSRGAGHVDGLGLLPVTTRYAPEKVLDPAPRAVARARGDGVRDPPRPA